MIDDEPAVHDGTRFALSDYRLNGQGLEILSAYSAAEGRELMRKHTDVAVVLLDVIMETDTAGLNLVEFIRKELKNETVRIILRTGQPGQAPERRVIVDYDINDYKAKTELTADKLFTALTAALRSHQQLQRMVETRRGLEIIIEAASTLFDFKSMQRLAEGVLTQIASLLNVDCAGILVVREPQNAHETFSVLAGSGCYSRLIGSDVSEIIDYDLKHLVEEAFARRHHEFSPAPLGALHQDAERPRSRRRAGGGAASFQHRSRAGRDLLQPPVDRIRQRHSLRATAAGEHPPRGTGRRAHAGSDHRQSPARGAMGAVAAGQLVQERDPRHRRSRLEKPAGRHSRPDRNIERDDRAERARSTRTSECRSPISATPPTGSPQMVDDLVADAMADALDITIRREPVDIAVLVQEVAEANRPLATRKAQTITVVAPPNHAAMCDSDRIREAIDNLVSNAVKYSPIGGTIDLLVAQEDGGIVVQVKDEGAGLSPEDISRLFGRFQRLSAKPTAGETSTGLGLSIVKRIVDLHGGRVMVESAGPGQGATFKMTLPVT